MHYNAMELHNVVELEPAPGGGHYLRRFPKNVRNALSPLGRMMAQEAAGCEIRFVTEAESIRFSVSALPSPLAPYELHNLDIFVFKGSFFHSHHRLEPGRIHSIHLADIGGITRQAFEALKPEVRDTGYFSHRTWRVLFGRYPAIFHDLDVYGYPLRAPEPEEKPKRRILFYGSSITNGASPTLYHLCYVQQAARHLQADALNQGLSGACHCEPEMADYLAHREDWDAICLEIGVNMRASFSPEQFESRARYLVEKICKAHPEKPVFLITIYPNGQSLENAGQPDEMQEKQEAFNGILRIIATENPGAKLHLVEGREILKDYSGITKDLIHPGDYGHAEMGRNLARKVEEYLPR